VNVHEVSDERVLSGIVDTREFSSRFMALVAGYRMPFHSIKFLVAAAAVRVPTTRTSRRRTCRLPWQRYHDNNEWLD